MTSRIIGDLRGKIRALAVPSIPVYAFQSLQRNEDRVLEMIERLGSEMNVQSFEFFFSIVIG